MHNRLPSIANELQHKTSSLYVKISSDYATILQARLPKPLLMNNKAAQNDHCRDVPSISLQIKGQYKIPDCIQIVRNLTYRPIWKVDSPTSGYEQENCATLPIMRMRTIQKFRTTSKLCENTRKSISNLGFPNPCLWTRKLCYMSIIEMSLTHASTLKLQNKTNYRSAVHADCAAEPYLLLLISNP